MNSPHHADQSTPSLLVALGAMAIVLGVFLTAFHGTEWMKQRVISGAMPADPQSLVADCPPGELAEEGLTLRECEFMVEYVVGIYQSMPPWFPSVLGGLSLIGMLLAFASILAGAGLINDNPRARLFALGVFSGLVLVDVLQFAVVVNAGPIVRSLYLWHIVLWLLLHAMMAIGVLTQRRAAA